MLWNKALIGAGGDVLLLTHESELALVRKMAHLPELVETMARNLEPHHLTYYATELATAFHWFYDNCRVLSSDPAQREMNAGSAEAGRGGPNRPLPDPGAHGHAGPRPDVDLHGHDVVPGVHGDYGPGYPRGQVAA